MPILDQPPPPPAFDGPEVFLVAGGLGPSPFAAYTQADFLDLFDHIFPDWYVQGLKDGGGYELLLAAARVGERLSQAVINATNGSYVSWAERGQKARVLVELWRQSAVLGAVTVKAGTIVKTSKNGRRFRTLQDGVFGAAALGPVPVLAEALGYGWEYNVKGSVDLQNGETVPGQIDTVDYLIEDPPLADLTIQVRQVMDAEGGQADCLGQLGIDRGLPPQPGEDTESYRIRIRQLPDTVSPLAIVRGVYGILARLRIPFALVEPFSKHFQTFWDAPSVATGDYDPTIFVYNDPRTPDKIGFRNRWLDELTQTGCFLVVVPNLPFVSHTGMFFDDPATDVLGFDTSGHPGWWRAYNCFDVKPTDPDLVNQGAYDGWDAGRRAIYGGINALVDLLRAGGVTARLETLYDYGGG